MSEHHCPNGHQLWKSWAGTSGCEQEGCPFKRPQRPSEEIVLDPHPKRSLPCSHAVYVGWNGLRGCRSEGCEAYIPGIDVTQERN